MATTIVEGDNMTSAKKKKFDAVEIALEAVIDVVFKTPRKSLNGYVGYITYIKVDGWTFWCGTADKAPKGKRVIVGGLDQAWLDVIWEKTGSNKWRVEVIGTVTAFGDKTFGTLKWNEKSIEDVGFEFRKSGDDSVLPTRKSKKPAAWGWGCIESTEKVDRSARTLKGVEMTLEATFDVVFKKPQKSLDGYHGYLTYLEVDSILFWVSGEKFAKTPKAFRTLGGKQSIVGGCVQWDLGHTWERTGSNRYSIEIRGTIVTLGDKTFRTLHWFGEGIEGIGYVFRKSGDDPALPTLAYKQLTGFIKTTKKVDSPI